ncbi:hypothetical protein [Nannocystis bainbridge]|nr:hypothetical protein [Nannocystis bainbridge]
MRRPELCVPDAAPEVQDALRSLAEQIEHAQAEILNDDDDADL